MSAQTEIYSIARNLTPVSRTVEYYGVIEEIIELVTTVL